MMKLLSLGITIAIIGSANAQSTGDTIIVKSLHHGSATRDTMVDFPGNPGLTFSKVLLKYNMRCKDGYVSDGSNRNKGCGEWDYSCNTYVHDSSRVDSLLSKQVSHVISSFTGSSFPYSNTVVNSYYAQYQKSVQLDSIINETASTVGNGSQSISTVLAVNKENGKSQFLFTATELISAGLTTGNINAIYLNSQVGNSAQNLRIRIKSTTDSILDPSSPKLDSLTEVFFDNFQFSVGLNRLQFHSPFAWNGSSGLVLEFSFTGKAPSGNLSFTASTLSMNRGIFSIDDSYFNFNSINYVEAVNFKGVGASNPRTVEAWIKTNSGGGEIVSWGNDVASGKWNLRLETTGQLRVEVNGGHKQGTTDLRDNKWHHVACTFSGTNVTDVKLYVDGILETTGGQTAKAVNTDTTSGINVRVNRGTNNRYFLGLIDEVRIWDTSLTAVEVLGWKNRRINSSHPEYGHLLAHYSFDEGSGINVNDSSASGHHALIMQGNQWANFSGIGLFKGFEESMLRPNVTFLQGNYLLTITTDTIYDTVPQLQHSVITYSIFPKPGGLNHDSIASSLSYLWRASYEYIFDQNGQKIDSIAVTAQGTITITNLNYYRRYPMKFEIMSFVTPYGIGLDMGIEGKTWTFDITDLSPVLKGRKRLTMEWGGQNQEEMDIQFWFVVGSPPRNVLDIRQIWRVTKPSYSSISLNNEFEPRQVALSAAGKAFAIRSAITGHGQEGEFIPRNHSLDINNNTFKETWQVWKECADNPIYPQGGTWIYDRAGWCPGAATDLKITDISQHVTAGSNTQIDYSMQFANGESNYIINHQIVTYGVVNKSLDVAVKDILSPNSAVEYSRTNYTCSNARVLIQNNGSTELTSVEISYWINDSPDKLTHNWTGNLKFGEVEEVELQGDESLWKWMKASGNKFYFEVSKPNSTTDQNAYNNSMSSEFNIPDVLPGDFVVWFKTNLVASENSYTIHDKYGIEILNKSSFQNNTEYRDTLDMGIGCYTLRLNDNDDDGIAFWANNDGSGFLRITDISGQIIKVFQPDFGKFIEFKFTTDFPLSYEEVRSIREGEIRLYPNPASSTFTLQGESISESAIRIFNSSGQEINLSRESNENLVTFQTIGLSKGIYLIRIEREGKLENRKLLIN